MAKIIVKGSGTSHEVTFNMPTAGHGNVLEKMLEHYWDQVSGYDFHYIGITEKFQFITERGINGEFGSFQYTITVEE